MKKILIGILVLSMCLCLMSSAIASDTVELLHRHNQLSRTKGATDTTLAEEFMKLHPNVKIVVEAYPSSAMADLTSTAIRTGELPNTQRDVMGRQATWWYAGVVEPLDGLLTQEDLDDFYPDVLGGFILDGHLLGIPIGFYTHGYGINKNITDAIGVQIPEGSWTLDEWEEMATKMKDYGVWPTVLFCGSHGGDPFYLMEFQAYGAFLWEDGDYTKTTLNSPQGVKALERMIELEKKGFAPPGTAGRKVNEQIEMMNAGKMGMGAVMIRQASKDFQLTHVESGLVSERQDIRFIEMPHLEGVPSPAAPFGSNGVIVFKSDSAEEVYWAKEWVKFLTSKDVCAFEPIADGCHSARRSVRLHLDNSAYRRALEIIVKNGVYDVGMGSPHYLECRKLLASQLQFAFLGKKTPKQALDDFAREVENLWE